MKNRKFLLGSGFLTSPDITQAIKGDIKTHSFSSSALGVINYQYHCLRNVNFHIA